MNEWLERIYEILMNIFSAISEVTKKAAEPVKDIGKSKEQKLYDLILKNSPGIGPKMTKMASKWFFHKRITNHDYMILVDYDYRESYPRMWVIDRKTGKSEQYKVAHGSKSDMDKDGYPTDFSNISGSHQSSLGAMVTQTIYSSQKFDYAMRLDGLEAGLNDLVRPRAIVFHSSHYVNDVKGQMIGDSWGCFAVSEATAKKIITEIDNGALLFAYHRSLDVVESNEPGIMNLQPAIDLIKKWEGLRKNAYLDPVGIWTIGYGTIRYPDGTRVKQGDTCTEAQAAAWLLDHVEDKTPQIDRAIKVPVSENEYCAIVSFVYNLGIGNFTSSTLLKKLNSGTRKAEVAAEFDRWVFAGGKKLQGLVNRRAEEKNLFLGLS